MKTLLILRHAKSSWNNAHLTDHDRPLNGRGKQDAPRVGQALKSRDLVPDLIITSTAERALATAEAAAIHCDYDHELRIERRFYLAGPETYLSVLRQLEGDPACVMVVGHNPGLEDLLHHLTQRLEAMPTAALAQVSLPIKQWANLRESTRGTLAWFWWPKVDEP